MTYYSIQHSHEPFADRIWDLRHNLTAYDAAYVGLGEGLKAPLITCDAGWAAAPGIQTSVELFAASEKQTPSSG